MFLSSKQLEPVLLKRLENFGKGQGLGLVHLVVSVIQAQNSAAGLEWSSNDGHEEGLQENVKVDVQSAQLAPKLDAWLKHVCAGAAISKGLYCAAAHALAQDIICSILSVNEPTIPAAALDAAWKEDATGADSISSDRFKQSLATVATACSSDGTPATAAACLDSLLAKLQGGGERWQRLQTSYGPAAKRLGGAAANRYAKAGDDDDDELDAVQTGARKPDIAPASDKSAATAASTSKAAKAAGDGGDADADDGASSLGLSRIASRASTASAAPSGVDPSTIDGGTASVSGGAGAAASRYTSSKSLMDPEMKRQISRSLSGASSADLDEMPDNLDALEQRQASHAKASTKPARQPLLAGLMASEHGKGHLAEMPVDLRSWADFKDKQSAMPPGLAGARGQRGDVSGSLSLAPGGRGPMDQHLKGTRGAAPVVGNPLHNAIITGSAARQSADRSRGGGGQQLTVPPGILRQRSNESNESPSRQRSMVGSFASNTSRKLSISEPAPTGQQAEWKHLPALGQASRLHPHDLRQPSRSALSRGSLMSPSASAAALIEDKLPMLPALTGARGQPPKAMELLRRPSQLQRSDAHHAGEGRGPPLPPNAHLPGLGGGKGPGLPQPARALRLPSKKSFRGDRDF